VKGGPHSADCTKERRLAARVSETKTWLYQYALPLWRTAGVDGGLGFAEELELDGTLTGIEYKRLRVQARQVYVFSHAYVNGYGDGLAAAANGWDFMLRYGWRDDGGWVRRCDRHGRVIDATFDLYDQATALFALAWWVRASQDHTALELADRTLDAVDERLAVSDGLGWLSEVGSDAALLQNPHMHLLEALLELYDVSGELRFKAKAEQVLRLFRSSLFNARTRTLAEYYDQGWLPAAGDRGRIVEPGHHYEWVWLLHRAQAVIGADIGTCGDALFDFAERYGRGAGGALIFDEVLDDGSVRASTHRLWPMAEALKAHLARFESRGSLSVTRLLETIDGLFEHFLAAPRQGLWIDRLDAGGAPRSGSVPASSFYHLFLALSELLRLEPRLASAGAVEG